MTRPIRNAFAYGRAVIAFPLIVLASFAGKYLATSGIDSRLFSVSPRFTGGKVVSVAVRGSYRFKVHQPVFSGLFQERSTGFMQVDWEPAPSFPEIIQEEVDLPDNGGKLVITFEPGRGRAWYGNRPPSVMENPLPVRTRSGWAVRIGLRRGKSGSSLPRGNTLRGAVLYIPSPGLLRKEEARIAQLRKEQEEISRIRKAEKERSRKISDSAVEAMRAGNFPAAQKMLREALIAYPENPEALMNLCSLLIRENNLDKALEACQCAASAVYSRPENRIPGLEILASEASFTSYKLLNTLGRKPEAARVLRDCIKRAPAAWPGLAEARAALKALGR